MTNSNTTKFENLPNELLFELFEYIDICDLYYGFGQLNKRMDYIIQSLQNLSLDLQRYEIDLISIYAKKITRLIVNTWQDIDLSQFSYLQSLILHQITGNQLRQIRSEYMPKLVYLSTSSIPEFSLMPQLAQRIFSNEMPTLRHVDLGHVHVPHLNIWTQSTSLRSVSIHSTDPTIVSFVLMSSPNLVYLRVDFLSKTIPIFRNLLSISNHRLKHFIISDPYHRLTYNHIYNLVAFIPNVRRIELNFLCKIPFIRFLQILFNRLQYLTRFDCNIDDISNDKTADIKTIQQVHSCCCRIQCSTNDFHFRTFITESNK